MMNRKLIAAAMTLTLAWPQPLRALTFRPQNTALPGSAPQGVNYQGRLEQNGTPVNGTHTMIFKLYDALTAGNLIWTSSPQGVTVGVGLFNTVLPIPITALVGGAPVYLDVTVDGTTLSPREALQSVPYAMVAKSVEGTIDLSTAGLNILPNASGTSALFISSGTGVIGINTATPAGRLDVNGNMVLRGSMTATGIAAPSVSPAGQGVLYFDSTANRFLVSENGGSYGPLTISGSLSAPFTITGGSLTVAGALGVGGVGLANGTLVVVSTSATPANPVADFRNNAGASVLQAQQGGNVGIGTTSPAATLDLFGTTSGDLTRFHDPYSPAGYLVTGYTGVDQAVIGPYRVGWRQLTINANPLLLMGGNVGIGTASPRKTLDVSGEIVTTTRLTLAQDPGLVTKTWHTDNSGGTFRLFNQPNINAAGTVIFSIDNSTNVSFQQGNVGIGTTAPANALDVNGGLTVRSSMTLTQIAAPPLSAANQGSIYFDSTLKHFMVSENGGGYAQLGTAGGGLFVSKTGDFMTGQLTLANSTLTVTGGAFSVPSVPGASTGFFVSASSVSIGTALDTTMALKAVGAGGYDAAHTTGQGFTFSTGNGWFGGGGGWSGGNFIVNLGFGTGCGFLCSGSAGDFNINGQTGFFGSVFNYTGQGFYVTTSDASNNSYAMVAGNGGSLQLGDATPARLPGVRVGIGVSPGQLFQVGASTLTATYGGLVGIGTNSPAAKLHMSSGTLLLDGAGAAMVIGGPVKIVDGTQGVAKVLTSDANGNASWAAAGGLPAGMVSFFNLGACPAGWSPLDGTLANPDARGRYLVGVPAAGTLAGTAGTALTNLENRPVGQHSHTITDPGHSHLVNFGNGTAGATVPGPYTNAAVGPQETSGGSTTGITINNSGTTAGTNAPYMQFLLCVKN